MATVLIVDDDVLILEAMAVMLEKQQHQVLMAFNAAETKALLREHTVDLIILDIILPGQGGMELLMDIRKELPYLPAIIMSGKISTELGPFKHFAHQFGVPRVLQKPFTMEELLDAVAMSLDSKRS